MIVAVALLVLSKILVAVIVTLVSVVSLGITTLPSCETLIVSTLDSKLTPLFAKPVVSTLTMING